MQKKIFLLGISALVLNFAIEAVDSNAYQAQPNSGLSAEREQRINEKYNILKRDQIDTTDVLAIPLDDSEVEDEEEVNQAEKKEVFNLPKPPPPRSVNSQNLPR